ncbi:MAG: glycosyltransferase family 2 protein [Clostridiales bacterium]|nr:glycosyltransferase family 2 protein [Clostridiales bacterium]
MKIIIQIPCYNEEEYLSWTVADLPRYIEGADDIEYLVIDDGSTDRTVETARGLGIHHIVGFKNNKGLARGFMTGIDACLRLGADIIVNTDADNQYCGEDIEKLVRPIINGEADIVIGERPIDETEYFSAKKKKLQRIGSWVVRVASGTSIPDAPSGFRAYSREAALRLNVINEYSYTLETIIQAGNSRMAITSVPVRTNPEMRKSRLFNSMSAYIKRSATVIVRAFMMYRPLRFFSLLGGIVTLVGLSVIVRFLVSAATGDGGGHVQSLVLAAMLVMIGVQLGIAGLQADLAAANRKLLEDVQYRVKKLEIKAKGESVER